jgi:hypothetical protein
MKISPLPRTGTAAKFLVTVNKRGEFMLSLSQTLRTVKWQITTPEQELDAATRMAEAIVGRHNPKFPFKEKYIFAEHNTEPSLESMIKYLQRTQL